MSTTRDPGIAYQTAIEHHESRIVTTPLAGDPTHRVMLCRYMGDIRHMGEGRRIEPLRKGTAHPAYPDMYCVIPDTIERQVDNLAFFTRTFATIPRSFSEVSASVVTLPGMTQPPTFASGVTITGAVPDAGGAWRLTAASHGYSAGDNVHVAMTASVPRHASTWMGGGVIGADSQYFNASVTVLRVVDTNRIDVFLGPNSLPRFSGAITAGGTMRKITAGIEKRQAATKLVTVDIRRDYFFPGISPEAPTRGLIPLFQPFRIEQGTTTDELWEETTLRSTTVPTALQYRTLIDNQSSLVLDCVLEEYLGPIVCRRTTSYIAQ